MSDVLDGGEEDCLCVGEGGRGGRCGFQGIFFASFTGAPGMFTLKEYIHSLKGKGV